MGRKRFTKLISCIVAFVLFIAMSGTGNIMFATVAFAGEVNDPTYVSTFNCIGLYWNPGIDDQGDYTCLVQYRESGTDTWYDGLDLWYDGRALNGRPAEFRGSIVNLNPGTTYDVKLTLTDENETTITEKTITASTMSENFKIKETRTIESGTSTLTISEGGSEEEGYILYDGTGSTIDVGDGTVECCIEVNASWVIIRGFTLRHGRHGIYLKNGCQHVVIEECDISQWGLGSGTFKEVNGQMMEICNDWDSAIRFKYHDPNIGHIIIQRNKMYDPAYTASTWDDRHPLGPNGISISTDNNVGHNIIRYNEIYTTNGYGYNDCIQGEENSSYNGCPGPDSDIYGNIIANSFDDGIEADGGGMNVRIWGNYFDKVAVAISSAANSMGPCYIFRNVANEFRTQYRVARDSDDRLTFLKCGSDDYSGGRRYVFHNTLLNPPPTGGDRYNYGPAAGIDQSGDCLENTVSRNNVFQVWKNWSSYIREQQNFTNNDFDYDLHNSDEFDFTPRDMEANGIWGVPIYKEGHGYVNGSGGLYELAENSPGYHAGAPINNFNSGTDVDMGAHQSGTPRMEFGVNAYRDIISNLVVYDSVNASAWSILKNIQPGDNVFGDRVWTLDSVPEAYRGLDWIRTACSSKTIVGTLCEFYLKAPAIVYVAHDITSPMPSWLDISWTETGDFITSSNTNEFSIFSKQFPAGIVSLGGNTDNGSTTGVQYIILVKALEPELEFEDIENKSVDVGSPLEFEVVATISNGASLIYSAKDLPDGAIFDPDTRIFSWTPAKGQEGTYEVTFTATDGLSASAEITVEITVNPVLVGYAFDIEDVSIDNKSGIAVEATITANSASGGNAVVIFKLMKKDGTVIGLYSSEQNIKDSAGFKVKFHGYSGNNYKVKIYVWDELDSSLDSIGVDLAEPVEVE